MTEQTFSTFQLSNGKYLNLVLYSLFEKYFHLNQSKYQDAFGFYKNKFNKTNLADSMNIQELFNNDT